MINYKPMIKLIPFSLLLLLIISSCKPGKKNGVSFEYPGGRLATDTAELFAPGILSTNANEHSAVAFAPDGSVVLWAVMDSQYRGRLFEMKYENDSWSKPASPAFADTTADHYSPCFSPDGKTLFFGSRRKAPEGYPKGRGNRIWTVARTPDGWGIPEPVDTTVSRSQEFGHSTSQNGTLYFAWTPEGPDLSISKAEKINGRYAKPVLLPGSINSTGYEDGPYIAPDERYLIFESDRPGGIDGSIDLYISFQSKNGDWSIPLNMGPQVNSPASERFARVSPDGRFLFFGSNRRLVEGVQNFDMYWIDAKIITLLEEQVAQRDQ